MAMPGRRCSQLKYLIWSNASTPRYFDEGKKQYIENSAYFTNTCIKNVKN
jgi:hypothetical protein